MMNSGLWIWCSGLFFALVHSALATTALKQRLSRLGVDRQRYRLGYSLLASMAHISAQFVTAWLLFIPHPGLWRLFPVLLTFAVALGIFNGIISHSLIRSATEPATDPKP